jgi:hypothetical protein
MSQSSLITQKLHRGVRSNQGTANVDGSRVAKLRDYRRCVVLRGRLSRRARKSVAHVCGFGRRRGNNARSVPCSSCKVNKCVKNVRKSLRKRNGVLMWPKKDIEQAAKWDVTSYHVREVVLLFFLLSWLSGLAELLDLVLLTVIFFWMVRGPLSTDVNKTTTKNAAQVDMFANGFREDCFIESTEPFDIRVNPGNMQWAKLWRS